MSDIEKQPDLNYSEEQVEYLLRNVDNLHEILTPDQISHLVSLLKKDVEKIGTILEELDKISNEETDSSE
jgi:hypothetical protein